MKVALTSEAMRGVLKEVADAGSTQVTLQQSLQVELVKAAALVQVMQDLNELKYMLATAQTELTLKLRP